MSPGWTNSCELPARALSLGFALLRPVVLKERALDARRFTWTCGDIATLFEGRLVVNHGGLS
jgi:hypothetical protein